MTKINVNSFFLSYMAVIFPGVAKYMPQAGANEIIATCQCLWQQGIKFYSQWPGACNNISDLS